MRLKSSLVDLVEAGIAGPLLPKEMSGMIEINRYRRLQRKDIPETVRKR